MKPYRTIATVLYTAALTSSWWAAALWATKQNGLMIAPVLLTIGAVAFLFIAAVTET